MLPALLLTRVFVTKEKSDSKTCTMQSPCNYQSSLSYSKSGDEIVFSDKLLSTNQECNDFRELVLKALKKDIIIDGNGIVVDGKNSSHFSPAFLFINGIHSPTIKNIKFQHFMHSEILIREAKNATLYNIGIYSSKLNQMFSHISVSSSTAIFENLTVYKSTVHDSSILSIHSSKVTIANSDLYQNFAFHASKQPLIQIMSSDVNFIRTNFENNNSPNSPLIRHEVSGHLNISNCQFMTETHTNFIFAESRTKTTIQNSKFEDCMGMIYATPNEAKLFISDSTFNECSAQSSLFYLVRASTQIKRTIFYKCASDVIFGLSSGSMNLRNCNFLSNKQRKSTISCSHSAQILIDDGVFQKTMAADALFNIETKASISSTNVTYSESWAPVALIKTASANFSKCLFENSNAPSGRIIVASKASLFMNFCKFTDESALGLFKFTGHAKLSYLIFKAPRNYALPNGLQAICENCVYGSGPSEIIDGKPYDSKAITITIIAGIIVGILTIGVKKYIPIKLFFVKKNQD